MWIHVHHLHHRNARHAANTTRERNPVMLEYDDVIRTPITQILLIATAMAAFVLVRESVAGIPSQSIKVCS